MKNNFEVTILTPYGKYLSMTADFLSVKASNGVLGILPNHAPLITEVEISKLVIKNGNSTLKYAISGGLLHIKEDTQIIIMTPSIERSDEIDKSRALAAKERAEKRLLEKDEVDVLRAKAALARALNRLSLLEE